MRRRYPNPQEAKAVVLGTANILAGLLDVLDGFSKGKPTGEVVRSAARRVGARSRAIARAEERELE